MGRIFLRCWIAVDVAFAFGWALLVKMSKLINGYEKLQLRCLVLQTHIRNHTYENIFGVDSGPVPNWNGTFDWINKRSKLECRSISWSSKFDLNYFYFKVVYYLLLCVLLTKIECWSWIQREIEATNFWRFAGQWSIHTGIARTKLK